MDKIDFIITWVDGNDPKWQAERAKFTPQSSDGAKNKFYRTFGTLKYWFRSVEKYAPWVNKIHFVTCGQHPEWLNENHPKLHFADHVDFIPKKYLPTFSVNPIELNFHRIEGLCEQFVYFNDDQFLCREAQPFDFFINGLPCDSLNLASLMSPKEDDMYFHFLFNNVWLVGKHFNLWDTFRKNRSKFINKKYSLTENILNFKYAFKAHTSGFCDPHLPNPYLKSTWEKMWNEEEEYLSEVCTHKFRHHLDVTQFIFRYYQLLSGNFNVISPKSKGLNLDISKDEAAITDAILNKKYLTLCVNDTNDDIDFEHCRKYINEVFKQQFPEKSSFEK